MVSIISILCFGRSSDAGQAEDGLQRCRSVSTGMTMEEASRILAEPLRAGIMNRALRPDLHCGVQLTSLGRVWEIQIDERLDGEIPTEQQFSAVLASFEALWGAPSGSWFNQKEHRGGAGWVKSIGVYKDFVLLGGVNPATNRREIDVIETIMDWDVELDDRIKIFGRE